MRQALLELVRQAKQTGDFGKLAEAVPYAARFGISVEHSSGELVGKLGFSQDVIGNPDLPAIHGGMLGGLLETTAMLQVLSEVETLVYPKIVNITVEYLRSARPVDTFARARISKLGRRVINVSAEAWQDDPSRPIARAHAHFLVHPIEDESMSAGGRG